MAAEAVFAHVRPEVAFPRGAQPLPIEPSPVAHASTGSSTEIRAPGAVASSDHPEAGPLAIGDLDMAIAMEAEYAESVQAGDLLSKQQELVSVSAANTARRDYRARLQERVQVNDGIEREAQARVASSSAANDLAELSAADSAAADLSRALEIADSAQAVPGPEWAIAAHHNHALHYFGGFVCYPKCGFMAQRSIARSKLRFQCPGHKPPWREADVRRLASRKLPRSEHTEWPDGGADCRAGANFRRIAR